MVTIETNINKDETTISKVENILANAFEILPQFLFSALYVTIGSNITIISNDKSIDTRKIYLMSFAADELNKPESLIKSMSIWFNTKSAIAIHTFRPVLLLLIPLSDIYSTSYII